MSKSNLLCVALLWMFQKRNQQPVYDLFNQSQAKQNDIKGIPKKIFLDIAEETESM